MNEALESTKPRREALLTNAWDLLAKNVLRVLNSEKPSAAEL